MAASLTVFSITPTAGIKLSFVGSTAQQGILQTVIGNDGHTYRLVKSFGSAIGSIATVKIGAAGSAQNDAGSAGFTMNAPGGIVSGQYAWCKKTAL